MAKVAQKTRLGVKHTLHITVGVSDTEWVHTASSCWCGNSNQQAPHVFICPLSPLCGVNRPNLFPSLWNVPYQYFSTSIVTLSKHISWKVIYQPTKSLGMSSLGCQGFFSHTASIPSWRGPIGSSVGFHWGFSKLNNALGILYSQENSWSNRYLLEFPEYWTLNKPVHVYRVYRFFFFYFKNPKLGQEKRTEVEFEHFQQHNESTTFITVEWFFQKQNERVA